MSCDGDDYYGNECDDQHDDGFNDGYDEAFGELYEDQYGADGGEPKYDGPVRHYDIPVDVPPEHYDGARSDEGHKYGEVKHESPKAHGPDRTACEEDGVSEEELDIPTQDTCTGTSVDGSSQGPTWTGDFREGYEITGRGVNEQGNRWTTRDYGLDAPNQNPYHYSNK